MRPIDEDTITQAVIARHAGAGDARLREVVTSLVQHLHAFARDVKLTEAEWSEGVRFLAECGRTTGPARPETALLSDMLGLTTLVTAANHRKPKGCTEATGAAPGLTNGVRHGGSDGEPIEPCFVRGRVRSLGGAPIGGAEVRVGVSDAAVLRTDADGCFLLKTALPSPQPIGHDGPVGRLLQALGRHPWRPAHIAFTIAAPGFERLVTQVFRQGDPYLDGDAVFGVRSSLVADWTRHGRGRTPDGQDSDVPFTTLDFTFVLDSATTGDKP
jgi:hydroxyquinol 1,2-dioxygenase